MESMKSIKQTTNKQQTKNKQTTKKNKKRTNNKNVQSGVVGRLVDSLLFLCHDVRPFRHGLLPLATVGVHRHLVLAEIWKL
jgi:hypothetical protein